MTSSLKSSPSQSKIVVPDKIGGFTVEHLLKTAEDIVKRKTKGSQVLDIEAEALIPVFHSDELVIGQVLGRGGFCVVSNVSKIVINDALLDRKQQAEQNGDSDPNQRNVPDNYTNEDHINFIVQDRDFMAKFYIRKGNGTRYAIKRLQESSFKDAQLFVNGVVDLAIEARFLSVIRHPNIIKMRAMRCENPFTDGLFFVVLDRLLEILSQRVTKWKKQQFVGARKLLDIGGKKEKVSWVERVTVAYDLTCALKYLHDLNIVYRDIKPENIGFDVRGDVKIFDFGLAKEFDPKSAIDGAYKLTGDTGSPRYMAVEVALNQPYNETCDVYSFCILLWQILELETPFKGFSMRLFDTKVVRGGVRPKINAKWPFEIRNILEFGWGDWKKRPSMEQVSAVLREVINQSTDEEILDLVDVSRKSWLSVHHGEG